AALEPLLRPARPPRPCCTGADQLRGPTGLRGPESPRQPLFGEGAVDPRPRLPRTGRAAPTGERRGAGTALPFVHASAPAGRRPADAPTTQAVAAARAAARTLRT